MSNHLEWGNARDALATVQRANRQDRRDYLHAANAPTPHPPILQANLVNFDGDGLALIGTRDEILTYLDRARAHIERHTEPGTGQP